MAEEEEQEQGQGEAAPAPAVPSKQPSLLRYLPIVVILLVLQAVGLYFGIQHFLLRPEDSGLEAGVGERPRVIPESNEPEESIDLGKFVVNPRSENLRLLLTTEITLAVAPDDAKAEIEHDAKIDQVKDAIIYELTHATPEELKARDGRDQVKMRMKARINELLYEGQVVDIFFGSFILQALPGYRSN